MARFRGTQLFMRGATRDVAFGTKVRALLPTPGAGTDFTVTFTSTTTITQTVNPFTNISNETADNRVNLGWAMNQRDASTNSMGSGEIVPGIGARRRYIPAGTWQFQFAWTSNAAALLANYDVVISYHVYRVAANGGTRTLLFSASAASVRVALTAGSDNGAASSSQPDYTFEADETLHVAVQITSAATSSVLGGTTNTVITCTRATSGSAFVTLPSPGLRDLYRDTNAAAGDGAGQRALKVSAKFASTGEGAGQFDRTAEFFREFAAVGEGVGTRNMLSVLKFLAAQGVGVGTRRLKVSKDMDAVGVGEGTRRLLVGKAFDALGEGAGTIEKLATYIRRFEAVGDGVGDLRRTVIFVRSFNATGVAVIKPRIKLDWDDLPDPGGGSGPVINVYRPLFLFEDD